MRCYGVRMFLEYFIVLIIKKLYVDYRKKFYVFVENLMFFVYKVYIYELDISINYIDYVYYIRL